MIEQSTAEFVGSINANAAGAPGLADIVIRGLADPSALDDSELARFYTWAMGSLRAYEIAHHQYVEGNLSDCMWEGMQGSLAAVLASVFVQGIWSRRKAGFSPRFQQLVQDLEVSRDPLDIAQVRDFYERP